MRVGYRCRELKAWPGRPACVRSAAMPMSAACLSALLVGALLMASLPAHEASAQAAPATAATQSQANQSPATQSPAAAVAGTLPFAVKAALPDAAPMGSGAYRWFGLKLYDVRLWAERKIAADNWSTTPFALELVYARTLYGERIAKASIDEIRQLGIGKPAQQAEWLAAMTRVFPDVAEGTQLIGVYAPGKATQFLRDGQVVGEIADPEFGKAFFAIWLHPKTSAPKLRAVLLGQKP